MSTLPWVCAWRHPQPIGAQGRCIGQTDLAVDRRKAKRLAHRIRRMARRQGWPRVVHTSPLQRCAAVGRQLRQWGWRHHVDAALLEMDFGAWDGQAWSAIAHAEVDAWCERFAHHAPGGGEPLVCMLARVAAWPPKPHAMPTLVVAHAGWMLSRQWLLTHPHPPLHASQWPRPPAYGTCWQLRPQ